MVGLMGPAGAGQLTKMINQICIAGLVQGLAEGIHFGKKAGLDIEKVIEVISKGAAGSWQMENRHKTMNAGKYDFGFAVDWMRKDLGICLDEADRNGAKLPVTALVDQFYKDVQAMGGKRWDTSSLLARLEKLSRCRALARPRPPPRSSRICSRSARRRTAQGMARYGIRIDRGARHLAWRAARHRQADQAQPRARLRALGTGITRGAVHRLGHRRPEAVHRATTRERWAAEFNSWDIVDGVSDLFVDTDHWRELITEFAADEREFVRRTGFRDDGWAAVHRKKEPDATFLGCLPLIEAPCRATTAIS